MKKKAKEKSAKRRVLNIVFVLLLLFPCAEIAARILGWKGQKNIDYKVESSPKNWLLGDSIYGIKLNSGEFNVTLNDSLTFSTAHTELGTRKILTNQSSSDDLFILGCSFTYGYGVDTKSTFAQLIANHFPSQRVTNFAVPGHGEVQALLKLKEKISSGVVPKTVLLVYSKEHPQRNIMNRSYRSALHIGFSKSNQHVGASMSSARFPYFSSPKSAALNYVKWNEIYKNWSGRQTFAIVNALQTSLETRNGDDNSSEVTDFLFGEMAKLCEQNKINFVIVNLDDSLFTKKFPKTSISTKRIPIHFDFSDHSLTNYPYDNHPNAEGHAKIATKIIPTLEAIINEK